MFPYLRSKEAFIRDLEEGRLASLLYYSVSGAHWDDTVDDSELASWRNSLAYMWIVLNHPSVPDDLYIGLEYFLEREKAGRADVMIGGYAADGSMHIAVIELKQWSYAERISADGQYVYIRFQPHKKDSEETPRVTPEKNPLNQVMAYCRSLRRMNRAAASGEIVLHPCVFLHNLSERDNPAGLQSDAKRGINVFCGGDIPKFRAYLAGLFGGEGDALQVFRTLKKGIDPIGIRELVSFSRADGWENGRSKLRPDQGYYFEKLQEAVDSLDEGEDPRMTVITGNPGSGKTVLALLLLGYCKSMHKKAVLLYRGAAPHKAFAEAGIGEADCMYITEYMKDDSLYDVMIMDEAHRCDLSEEEFGKLLKKAKMNVFMADFRQRIHPSDNGARLLEVFGKGAEKYTLWSQFRCNMDDGYVAWVDDMLQINSGKAAPADKTFAIKRADLDFDVEILRTADEAMALAKRKDVLVLSGACGADSVYVAGVPESLEWFRAANDLSYSLILHHFDEEKGVNYAGKIFDIHGLEGEEILVIIGPDLYLDEQGTVRIERSQVKSFKLPSDIPDEEAEELVKNTYRVLLTRGMRKCSIYCCDEALRQYFLENG